MQVYSFLNTILLINGVEITGWAEGDDAIVVKRTKDSASDSVGAAGEMMVSVSADRSGTFTFKLQQTSDSNNYLYGLVTQLEGGSASFIPVTCTLQDISRGDVATGTVGYLTKPADMTRGEKGSSVEWNVKVENVQMLTGAGNGVASALSALTNIL